MSQQIYFYSAKYKFFSKWTEINFIKFDILCLFRRQTNVIPKVLNLLSSVQLLSWVWLSVTTGTAARQASLSITSSQSPPKPMSIMSVMPSNHLILCRPLLLRSIFPSIRVFLNESALRIRWPKYWSFSFNLSPSNEHLGLTSFRMTGQIFL